MRKYYSITPTGEKMLEEFKARYERITESAKKVLYE
jgi:DNA-binding PadR family transcriptional regulator